MKRIIIALVLGGTVAALAAAQTVAEAAAKEKERREGLQGKTVTTVSNLDLGKTKKKPAVSGAALNDAQIAAAEGERKSTVDAEARRKADIDKKYGEMKAELEDRSAKARERADLLDLKLKSLQQKFMTFNTMDSKAQVQQEIAQTYQMLQAAGAEAAKAKGDLDKFMADAAKDKAAAVGLK